jgi:O-antigen/teichoic acid export membrane protein
MNRPFSRVAVLKAGALMAASTYVTVALGLIVSALIARGLGPQDYGRYVYVLWLTSLLIVIGNNGLGVSGIRFVSESLGRNRADEAANVHGWLRKRQWFSLAGVCIVFLIALPFIQPAGWDGHQGLLIGVVCVSFVAKAIFQFDVSMAKGHGRFNVEAWSTMIMSVLYTVGVGALLMSKSPLSWYLVFFSLISLGHVFVVAPMLKQDGIHAGNEPCSPELIERLKPHLWWTIVQVAVATLSNKTIETFLLNSLIGPAEVGFFAIATNLTRGGVELVSSSLTSLLMPMLAHAYGAGGMKQVNTIMADAVRYCVFLGLILAGLGLLWAAFGIALMYGDKYTPVVNVLRIMVVVGGLTLAESAFGALLTTTDNQRLRAFVALFSVGISVLCAVTLVPIYGLMGAAWANAISRMVVMIVITSTIVFKLEVSLPWRELRGLLISGAMGLLATAPLLWWSNTALTQFVAGIIYVVVLVVASALVGGWHQKDARMLLSLTERKPRLLGWLAPSLRLWLARHPQST